MTSSKHDNNPDGSPFTDDLERNPGIGQSKGAFATGEDPLSVEGDNTVEGDVENNPDAGGAVRENDLGRTTS